VSRRSPDLAMHRGLIDNAQALLTVGEEVIAAQVKTH
jgi:hypothetical protein